jgi:hypothetical protein
MRPSARPGISEVLRPPIAADLHAAGHVLVEAAENVARTLLEWLQGRQAIATLGDVPADHVVAVVIDRADRRSAQA